MNHFERQKNRDLIAAELLKDPAQSDRTLARALDTDRSTVRKVRRQLEREKEIAPVRVVVNESGRRQRVFFDRRRRGGEDDLDDDGDNGFSVGQLAWLTRVAQPDANRFELVMLKHVTGIRACDDREALVTRGLAAGVIDEARAAELRTWIRGKRAQRLFFVGDKRGAAALGYTRQMHQRQIQAAWERAGLPSRWPLVMTLDEAADRIQCHQRRLAATKKAKEGSH